jgi:hypothetical protein
VLTLYTTPVIYLLMSKLRRKPKQDAPARESAAAA